MLESVDALVLGPVNVLGLVLLSVLGLLGVLRLLPVFVLPRPVGPPRRDELVDRPEPRGRTGPLSAVRELPGVDGLING